MSRYPWLLPEDWDSWHFYLRKWWFWGGAFRPLCTPWSSNPKRSSRWCLSHQRLCIACREGGLEQSGWMGMLHRQSARCTAALRSTPCWLWNKRWVFLTGLDELSWVQCNCAGTVPVACDVRGDIARGTACFCSAQLVTGQMTWRKMPFAVKIIGN